MAMANHFITADD